MTEAGRIHSLAYGEGGVASRVAVGLVHKHQLVAGVRESCAQQLFEKPKHLTQWRTHSPPLALNMYTHTWYIHVHGVICTHIHVYTVLYLMHKLDSVLEDWEQSWKTKMCHFLHHRVRVHLKTPEENITPHQSQVLRPSLSPPPKKEERERKGD